MADLIICDMYGVTELKGIPVVNSRKIAEVFSKEHKDVLESIRKCGCSEEFNRRNFSLIEYKDSRGRKQPEYLITKDGFIFIVMGFTGEKATKFKEAYINRFNEMESFIKSLTNAKLEFPEFTASIMSAHEEPKHYHFSNEINMINRIVLGMDAKKFKEVNNLGTVKSIRPYLTCDQIKAIEMLQKSDIALIVAVPDFEQRKRILQTYFNKAFLQKQICV